MIKKLLPIVLVLISFSVTNFSQEIKRNGSYQLIWADEFNYTGAPKDSFWTHEIMQYPPNDELEYYVNSRKNSVVEDGFLKLRAVKEKLDGRDYTSARLVTRDKVDWKYGRIEVRAKLPGGKGTWPAIWMLYSKETYGGWPASGEIDIMEHVGQDKYNVYGTIHTKSYNHTLGTQKGGSVRLTDVEEAFHVYGCEWNEDSVKIFVDNNIYFTFLNEHKGYETWPYDHNLHLILNIAIGGGWGGTVDNTIFKNDTSVQMLIDYVRLYKKSTDYSINGPKQVVEKSETEFKTNVFAASPKFQWILPNGVDAISSLDSSAVKVKWGCQSDTLALKVMGMQDTSISYWPVQVKEPKIKGKIWIPENSTNIKYFIDSLPGAKFKWTADVGISFSKSDTQTYVLANFSNEGTIYNELTTSCGVRMDSINVRFGTGEFPYPDAKKPAVIPGTIKAANFDAGGEGIAYHDLDAGNQGKAFRNDENVDIESYDNSFTIGWFDSGEWLKYTVNVSEAKLYKANFRIASGNAAGGKFQIYVDDSLITTASVKNTGAWNTFSNLVVYNIPFKQGNHIIKIKSGGGFNLGDMTFSMQTAVENLESKSCKVYPNPASDFLKIEVAKPADLTVNTLDGRVFLKARVINSQDICVLNWPRGIYTIVVNDKNSISIQKIVLN